MEDARPRGRPKRTWREVVQMNCQACKLIREDATMDHSRWRNTYTIVLLLFSRKQKRIIDEQDRYEWGNVFFLVPAYPCSPRQMAIKR